MRLGLFGGTFDPIHLGHLILAEQCREACRLDRVWFVVTGAPPHKPGERTPVTHRLEMARIADRRSRVVRRLGDRGHGPGPALQRRDAGNRFAASNRMTSFFS